MLPNAINSKRQQQEVFDRKKALYEHRELEKAMELDTRIKRVFAILLMVAVATVAIVLVVIGTGCSASFPHLINLQVETAPPADIYFDGLLVGSGTTRIHMFSDLVPNYLEIRDIITGETISRILLHKIPDLQVLSLRYKSETRREERIKIIRNLIESENIVNGQTAPGTPADPRQISADDCPITDMPAGL